MTKFGHLESYMIRNKLLEMSISREKEKKKKKEREREKKKEYTYVNQRLHKDFLQVKIQRDLKQIGGAFSLWKKCWQKLICKI